jgi:serine/threonine protein kinase
MPRHPTPSDLLLADVLARRATLDEGTVEGLLTEARARDASLASVAGDLPDLEAARAQVAAAVEEAGGDALRALRARLPLAGDLGRHLGWALEDPGPGDLPSHAAERYADFVPVGQGGMGIVYWARDRLLQRQVALKVVRPPSGVEGSGVTPPAPFGIRAPERGTPEDEAFEAMSARFLEEAWLTGGMEHPGVVPVYDLGRTERGVPYYTMRFVRGGRTLADALEEATRRGFEARLALLEPFLKACDAVAYAHSRGITHRDLKPGNVALGAYGDVVVLDWGLAKLRGLPEAEASRWQRQVHEHRETKSLTTASSPVGTPGYMAPEAARGEAQAIDERSDVWSLGAILHEILTGQRPFPDSTLLEYARRVNAEDAPDARIQEPGAPAALAEVTRRALARDPARRPPGPAALAAVVRTWQAGTNVDREVESLVASAQVALGSARDLAGDERLRALDRAVAPAHRALELRPGHAGAEAVLADASGLREEGIRERERRARRTTLRRAVLLGAAALVLGGAWFAWGLDVQRRRAERARAEAVGARRAAEAERARAETLLNFVVGELHDRLEPMGRLEIMTRVAEQAAAYYEGRPAGARSPESLLRQCAALRHLGDVRRGQGNLPGARASYEAALRVTRTFPPGAQASREERIERATVAMDAAHVQFLQGHVEVAQASLRTQVAELDALAGEDPEGVRDVRADALGHLAATLVTTGGWKEAEASQRRALDLAREAAAAAPADVRRGRDVVRQRMALARIQVLRGHGTRAGESAQTALDEARALAQRAPFDVLAESCLAEAHLGVGAMHAHLQESAKALADAQEAVRRYEALTRRDPGNRQWIQGLALALQEESDALAVLPGRQAEAHAPLTRALDLVEGLLRIDPTNATWRNQIVTLCDRAAKDALHAPGGVPRALQFRRRARDEAQTLLRRDPGNAKWRHLYAYTLASFARDAAATDAQAARQADAQAFDLIEPLLQGQEDSAELLGLLDIVSNDWLGLLARAGDPRARAEAAGRLLSRYEAALEADPRATHLLAGRGNALRALYESASHPADRKAAAARLRAAIATDARHAADAALPAGARAAWHTDGETLGTWLRDHGGR